MFAIIPTALSNTVGGSEGDIARVAGKRFLVEKQLSAIMKHVRNGYQHCTLHQCII